MNRNNNSSNEQAGVQTVIRFTVKLCRQATDNYVELSDNRVKTVQNLIIFTFAVVLNDVALLLILLLRRSTFQSFAPPSHYANQPASNQQQQSWQ